MQEVHIESLSLRGITTRTSNANEMKPETAKLGKLWQDFDKKVLVDYPNGNRVYGIYYDYASDANGEFSVMAAYDGTNNVDDSLENITIESGKYLRFDATAKTADDAGRIEAIIATWGKVWQYFSGKTEHERTYKTDFEAYKNQSDIEIYISIK